MRTPLVDVSWQLHHFYGALKLKVEARHSLSFQFPFPTKDFTMRWLQGLLSISLLSVGAFGAKKSSEERFKKYHTKGLSSSPVKLNDASYKDLTAVPRDYTGVVLLTALESRFGCELCRQFQPEWELLSRSWTKGDKKGDSRVLFGTLDFSDGRETFVAVGFCAHSF
jgi:oligosaccharyltransferase complex subunit gamma